MQGINSTAPALPVLRPFLAPPLTYSKAVKRQSDLRLAVGWLTLVMWGVATWALDWDADWHSRVGRDGFWTPPHLVFYSTIAATGIICVGMVLLETFLYYRRYPGYNDETTSRVLYFFRGPVGFILAGFGMVVMLGSAPLDDYWHRIYGIDLAVWAPFHVMLLLGILIASLGLVYAMASEVVRRQGWQVENRPTALASASPLTNALHEVRGLFHPATIGLIVAVVFMITRYCFLVGFDTARGSFQLGSAVLPAYSLLVLPILPVMLVALAMTVQRFGVATLAGLLFLLFVLVDKPLIQWGVDYLVTNQGRTLRNDRINETTLTLIYPLFLPLAGLMIDLLFLASRPWRTVRPNPRNLFMAVGATLAAGLILYLLDQPWVRFNELIRAAIMASGNPQYIARVEQVTFKPDYWLALPLVVVMAALAGLVSWGFGLSLRHTDR